MRQKISLHIILLLLCLVLLTVGTYAWFSRKFNLAAKGETIQLEYGGITISNYHVYKYIQETGKVKDLTVDDKGKSVDLNNKFELTPYDSIFLERNVNTPLVFEITLELEGVKDLYLNCRCEDTLPIPVDPTKDARYSSNIMRVGAATESCIPIEDKDDIDDIFYSVAEYFKEPDPTETEPKTTGLTYSFVDVATDTTTGDVTFTKKLTLPVRVERKKDDEGKEEELPESGELKVYYVLDYASALVAAQKVDDFSLLEILQSVVPFNDDIEFTGFDSTGIEEIRQFGTTPTSLTLAAGSSTTVTMRERKGNNVQASSSSANITASVSGDTVTIVAESGTASGNYTITLTDTWTTVTGIEKTQATVVHVTVSK